MLKWRPVPADVGECVIDTDHRKWGEGVIVHEEAVRGTPNGAQRLWTVFKRRGRQTVFTPAGRLGGVAAFGRSAVTQRFVVDADLFTQLDGCRLVLDVNTKTLRRFNADGTLDATFNHNAPLRYVTVIAFGPAGTHLIADTGRSDSDPRFVVRRTDS